MNKFDHNAIYIGMTEQLLFSKDKYARTDMSFLAKISSLDYGSRHRVLLISYEKKLSDEKYLDILKLLRIKFGIYFSTMCNNLLMCILPEKMIGIDHIKKIYHSLEELHGRLKLASSTVKYHLEECNIALQEATRTYDMVDSINKYDERILLFEDLGIYSMLYDLKDWDVFNSFYYSLFSDLWKYDNDNGANLFETLELFFKNNCDRAKTSADLFIHENTLRYRLHQIEEIMNCDLKNVNTIADIVTAFKVRRMVQILDDV